MRITPREFSLRTNEEHKTCIETAWHPESCSPHTHFKRYSTSTHHILMVRGPDGQAAKMIEPLLAQDALCSVL
jgi:hypothetical protein